MAESSQYEVDLMEASIFEMVNNESCDLQQDGSYVVRDYDVNTTNESISLSQYYSQFADDMPESVSGCVNYESSKALNKNVINYNVYNDQGGQSKVKKPKIWKCTYNCGKIFTREKYMRNHISIMHEKISLIQCKICSLYLSTKARLKNHMVRHLGVDRFVCLLCTTKRTNDKSCMRHHLSEKHGISCKHTLFHECYYELSLKEISLINKSKGVASNSENEECFKHPSVSRKSANDIEELKQKITEKSKRVKDLFEIMKNAQESAGREEIPEVDNNTNDFASNVNNVFQIFLPEPQKIVTAENGMKLMKLPNGEFKKIAFI